MKELLRNDPELAAQIEAELWENIDKLYARPTKPAKGKAKVSETEDVPEEVPMATEADIDAMVED